MPPRILGRRQFCLEAIAAIGAGGVVISGCAPKSPIQTLPAGQTPTHYMLTPNPNLDLLPSNFSELSPDAQDVAKFNTDLYQAFPPVFFAGPNEVPYASTPNLMQMTNPAILNGFEGHAPSESKYMEALSKMNITQDKNYVSVDVEKLKDGDFSPILPALVGMTVAAKTMSQAVVQSPFIKAVSVAEAAALMDPIPLVDELVIGGVLVAATIGTMAMAMYKFNKNKPQVRGGRGKHADKGSGHTHPTHDPKDPNFGHVARRIIQEVSQRGEKAGVACFLVKSASGALRFIRTIPVLGTANNVALLAWYQTNPELGVASGWGGAFAFEANPYDLNAVLNTSNWGESITRMADEVCSALPLPGPNQYK